MPGEDRHHLHLRAERRRRAGHVQPLAPGDLGEGAGAVHHARHEPFHLEQAVDRGVGRCADDHSRASASCMVGWAAVPPRPRVESEPHTAASAGGAIDRPAREDAGEPAGVRAVAGADRVADVDLERGDWCRSPPVRGEHAVRAALHEHGAGAPGQARRRRGRVVRARRSRTPRRRWGAAGRRRRARPPGRRPTSRPDRRRDRATWSHRLRAPGEGRRRAPPPLPAGTSRPCARGASGRAARRSPSPPAGRRSCPGTSGWRGRPARPARPRSPVGVDGSTTQAVVSTPCPASSESMNRPRTSSPTTAASAVRSPSRAAPHAVIELVPPTTSSACSTQDSPCPNCGRTRAPARTRSGLQSPTTSRSRSRIHADHPIRGAPADALARGGPEAAPARCVRYVSCCRGWCAGRGGSPPRAVRW